MKDTNVRVRLLAVQRLLTEATEQHPFSIRHITLLLNERFIFSKPIHDRRAITQDVRTLIYMGFPIVETNKLNNQLFWYWSDGLAGVAPGRNADEP